MRSQVYKNGQTAYIGNLSRTKFEKPLKNVKTSMNVGKLYPVRWEEVLPGTNWKSDTSFTATLTSAYLRPVKDDLFIDHYTFFVPLRLLYDGLENVFGRSTVSAYDDGDLSTIPTFDDQVDITSKTVGDYLGLPVGTLPANISVLPFRAFALIYNEWFRNQNVDDGVQIHLGNVIPQEFPNSNPWGPSNYTGQLPNVTKLKDYFTVAVPSPQKGNAVSIGTFNGFVPLTTGTTLSPIGDIKLTTSGGTPPSGNTFSSLRLGSARSPVPNTLVADFDSQNATTNYGRMFASNLGIDAQRISGLNVNDLRMAVALQRMQEIDIFGGRYREYLLAHYNVNNGDARMQVPEFLGGRRCPLFNQTVAQTSQGSQSSPLAALAGFSETADARGGSFSKAFTEHGYLMTVACIRQRHTYQQGVQIKWMRSSREDFYDPCFAHIGNQPIWQSELYALGVYDYKENVFGYKEAWSEYKQSFNEVSGEARTAAENSLDLYHFADHYSSAPVLGKEFIDETANYVGRTLAVSTTQQDPFFVDWCFRDTVTLPIPLNCDPGLLDHRG